MKKIERKRFIWFSFVALLLIASLVVWAKTNYFDNIVVDGTSTLGGTLGITGVATLGAASNITVTDATNAGGLFVSQFTVTYAQTDSYTICTVPANADVTKVEVITTTAFNGTTVTMDVGYVGTLEAYSSDLDVKAVGFHTQDVFSNLGDVGTSDVVMKAQLADGSNDCSAGEATVLLYWTMGTPGTP